MDFPENKLQIDDCIDSFTQAGQQCYNKHNIYYVNLHESEIKIINS